MPGTDDYLKYYDDESYLLGEVRQNFRKDGVLEPVDFYMLLAWKSNRAKNRTRDRLAGKCGTFANAVRKLASQLHATEPGSARLELLMAGWQFYLPTATAILAILYSEEFTVYDYRVREIVGGRDLSQCDYSAKLWEEYASFRERVREAAPHELRGSLRDCDRYLSGESYRKDAIRDCQAVSKPLTGS